MLFYNEFIGYKRDVEIANSIISEIRKEVNDLNKPIFFVSKNKENLKMKDLKINVDSRNDYFTWGFSAFFGEKDEIIKFFNHLGYEFEVVEDADKAFKIYDKLSDEQKEKDVLELDDFIAVKIPIQIQN